MIYLSYLAYDWTGLVPGHFLGLLSVLSRWSVPSILLAVMAFGLSAFLMALACGHNY